MHQRYSNRNELLSVARRGVEKNEDGCAIMCWPGLAKAT